MTDGVSARMDKLVKTLSEDKIERYEQAVFREIVKYFGLKMKVDENPGISWAIDNIPSWGFGSPHLLATRLEHNWADFFSKTRKHPLESLYEKTEKTIKNNEPLIIVFKWVPNKFMVFGLLSASPIIPDSYLSIKNEYYVTSLDLWLEANFDKSE